jgi:hypothetical protein
VYFWLNNTYFGLFQGQFNIHTPKGEELCFRAAGKVDCDGWAHAVGAVIRSLTVSNQVKINCDGWGGHSVGAIIRSLTVSNQVKIKTDGWGWFCWYCKQMIAIKMCISFDSTTIHCYKT